MDAIQNVADRYVELWAPLVQWQLSPSMKPNIISGEGGLLTLNDLKFAERAEYSGKRHESLFFLSW